MKHIVTFILMVFASSTLVAQQFPISEGYTVDRYSLSPSYAGNHSPGFLTIGYRSDWTGIPGGPKTFRLSYNDTFKERMGYGGKIVYDKAGIFNQFSVLGTYSYRLSVAEGHDIAFGLSAGLFSVGLNLTDYYNDPDYNIDPSLIGEDVRAKMKFISDYSIVYLWSGLEAGITISNLSFGTSKFGDTDLYYKPLAAFTFHTAYTFSLDEDWTLVPLSIVRGGKDVRSQFDIAVTGIYSEKLFASLLFRDPGIFGLGLGANIDKGLRIGYNFNFASNVALNAFNNHEITLGINIRDYIGGKQ